MNVFSIQRCPLPAQALLGKYSRSGAYTDCYGVDVVRAVTQADYVEAFYTGALFKLERLLIAAFMAKPSTDAQVRQLAAGELAHFAAWRVEDRAPDQLLMCDISGRTRSWLMVSAASTAPGTRLYFGSAVVPALDKRTGEARMGLLFNALLGFHALYSRALLSAAHTRLNRPLP